MEYDTIEYSVCEDCLHALAYDEVEDPDFYAHVERELGGKEGHFSVGVEQTEDDPEGNGYEEFSWHACELCNSTLGGSRYGVTLFIRRGE